MQVMKPSDLDWSTVYRAMQQVNLYPFDIVVSYLNRMFPDRAQRGQVHLLEVACGTGNNLWFAAREGFQCSGFDVSQDAIAFAQTRLQQEGLQAQLSVADLSEPFCYAANEFEVIIDRQGLTCLPYPTLCHALRECARVLKPGGKMLFTPYAATARPQEGMYTYSKAEISAALAEADLHIQSWTRTDATAEQASSTLLDKQVGRSVWTLMLQKPTV